MSSTAQRQRSAFVTGANGYIGAAVARSFQKAGYTTYGLIRSPRNAAELKQHSIIPIIGSASDSDAVVAQVTALTSTLDVIASNTDDNKNFMQHFNDTLGMLRKLAKTSNDKGVRPLVLFTSGCKDYGRGGLSGSANLQPHSEFTPLNPPSFLANRARYSLEVLKEESFDAAVLRPTNVHGYSSSYYSKFFEEAAAAKDRGSPLRFQADPRTILHSLHVDDCGDAYAALADRENREDVRGQCFNISPGERHETLQDVDLALRRLYGIQQETVYDPPEDIESADLVAGFSQWVGSQKIRELTGWKEKRPLFAEGIERYKQEYESALNEEDQNLARVQGKSRRKK